MQWPEIVVLVMVMTAAWARLSGWREAHAARLAYVALALAGVILAFRGPALQLAPLALAALLVTGAARRSVGPVLRRVLAMVALACASTGAGLLIVLPFFSLPKPTGPYAVGTRIDFLADRSRGLRGAQPANAEDVRTLVIQVWYPAATTGGNSLAQYVRLGEMKPLFWYMAGIRTNSYQDAPRIEPVGGGLPVLIYGHSWGSRRTVDTFLAEELASHGYVVVAIDHPLNAALVELADGQVIRGDRADALSNVNAKSAAAIEAVWAGELKIWVADQQFVLRQLPGLAESGALDMGRVGAFGHSFGGAAAFAMLGAPGDGPQVKAAANLDGWTFDGLATRTSEPMLMVYAGRRAAPPDAADTSPEATLDRDDRAAVEASLAGHGGYRAYVRDTQHLDFTDQTLVSPLQRLTYTGPMKGARAREITRGLLVGFFDRELKGTSEVPRFDEVEFEDLPRK